MAQNSEYLDSLIGTGIIQARVTDFEHGLRIFDEIVAIRIKSKEYSLLIMEDYFPIMGGVSGTVDFLTNEDSISLGKIKGYFVHRNNEFRLMVDEFEPEPVKETPAEETEETETAGKEA